MLCSSDGIQQDDERLKNGGSVLTTEYFDRLLEQIREIRLSERRFYQKITDIYATALDYDRTAKTTKQFFAKVQNKMDYAVHGHTAAAPEGKIVKSDVSVAKNYLSEQEMRSLERIVSAYLDLAEDRVIQDRLFVSDFDKYMLELEANAKKRRHFGTFHISLNRFPMTDINPDLSSHCEIVCLLGKRKPDTTVKLSVDMEDYYRIKDGKDEEL